MSQSIPIKSSDVRQSYEMTRTGAREWVLVVEDVSQTMAGIPVAKLAPVREHTVTIARRMVSLSAGDVSVASVTLVVRMVNERLRGARWATFSRELQEVATNVDNVRPEMVIATLRSAYRWRNKLPGWAELLDRARSDFVSRGLPADRLLRGLD